MSGPDYAELGVRSNFSFLEGASHPGELVEQAQLLGLAAIGIADRNTLAGVVRAHVRARELGVRLLIGCRLVFTDATELIVYPRDRAAYGRLCRLLSIGKSEMVSQSLPSNVVAFPGRPPLPTPPDASPRPGECRDLSSNGDRLEGEPGRRLGDDGMRETGADGTTPRIAKAETRLCFDQAAALGEGMIALVPAPERPDAAFVERLSRWRRRWPDTLHLAVAPLWRGDDRARLATLAGIAAEAEAPLVASNAVLYHAPDRRMLQDVLACTRLGTTIDKAGFALEAHAERFLKLPEDMAALFTGHEAAIARTVEIADACTFSLEELAYEYPDEPVPPGWTPGRHLIHLTYRGARERWPGGVPAKVIATLAKELRMIRKLRYAPYFITVHDIVGWARGEGILCQGRGSAANSIVCYCLWITAVDPMKQDVLMERFISEERREPPDIDVDFEHERREEVMQYIYGRYGRDRAAIVATVIHYRPRSAIRDVGKALGLTEDVTARLGATVWGSFGHEIRDEHVDATGMAREDPRLALALRLTDALIGFPRHLSQHVGGYVLTRGPLIECVPVGNGAMEKRTFIEWDKDDIDALKMMKVDILALGMLTALRKGFEMLRDSYGVTERDGRPIELATASRRERPVVYDMLCRADSLGVFQVESRAQMSMLPRLKPRIFYDLVVEVAIVRPGPIQGNMVHPYLRNRAAYYDAKERGRDPPEIDFPSPPDRPNELKDILSKTFGVPLFQEQAMKIAIVAAEFTGKEANQLRHAMATFRRNGTISLLERRMVDRMIARGYPPDFAENLFGQIRGFGEYGFPESHAVSFGYLVYVSSWMKCAFPEIFCAALLNSQPMGFYAPAQIVRDVRAHGIEVRHVDVGASAWDCTLEPRHRGRRRAVRLGMRQIGGFRRDWADAIVRAREGGAFASLDDLRRRANLPAAALDRLAGADALGSLDLGRRQGQWAAGALAKVAPAPLFEAAGIEEGDGAVPDALPRLSAGEEVVGDYRAIRLSLKGHPVAFLRARLDHAGVTANAMLSEVRAGSRVSVAGVVLVRQRPGTAKGVVFLTIEDETGVANIVLWKDVFERFRVQAMGARMLIVHGRVQRADGVTHIVGERLEDYSAPLMTISDALGPRGPEPRPRHPRNLRVLPASRDFH